jgi:hypothetical protein
MLFSRSKSYVLNRTNKGWAKLWAIFMQTHLVTLVSVKRFVTSNGHSSNARVNPVDGKVTTVRA